VTSVALILVGALAMGGCTSTQDTTLSSATASTMSTTAVTETASTHTTSTATRAEDSSVSSTTSPVSALLALTEVGSGFEAPVLLVSDPRGSADLIVEQRGTIVRNDADHTVVLDISDDATFEGEQGLLGLAFHPDFSNNDLAYVNYIDRSGATVIEEFTVIGGLFDPVTRRTIMTVDQPARNHNGGMIAFGPDGYLWIGMGDGGSANDRFQQAQDPHTLLGAMLRIDVDSRDQGAYGIPPDNPYADGVAGAPEVWATGLRNPWRFSLDGQDLWIADVGQRDIEEVNLVDLAESGANLGWPIMEGSVCFGGATCDQAPFVTPVSEYSHDDGCSITGGHVYRGTALPRLDGQFFFSDFCSGFLRSVTSEGTVSDWTGQVGQTSRVSGFGIGFDGELYVVSLDGSVYRLQAGS
jgi:glucose/arabinose dehydrogenase